MFSLLLAASSSLIVAVKGGGNGHMGMGHSAGGSDTIEFDQGPLCGDVWDDSTPPLFADAAVVATMNYLDGQGYYTPALGGTVPFDSYLQLAIAVYFNVGPGGSPSVNDGICAATLEIAQTLDTSSNTFGPVLANDLIAVASLAAQNWTFAEYVGSLDFLERRICPCYQMLPRTLFENLNCRPTADSGVTLSQSYFHCQAVDTDVLYSNPANALTSPSVPMNRDATTIANWQGCQTPGWNFFQDSNCNSERDAGWQAAVAAYNIVPSVTLPGPPSGSWLDDTAGSCMPCSSKSEEANIAAAFDVKEKAVHTACSHPAFINELGLEGGGCKGNGGKGNGGMGKAAGLNAESGTLAKSKSSVTAALAASGLVVCAAVFAGVRRARQQQPASDTNTEYGTIEATNLITEV